MISGITWTSFFRVIPVFLLGFILFLSTGGCANRGKRAVSRTRGDVSIQGTPPDTPPSTATVGLQGRSESRQAGDVERVDFLALIDATEEVDLASESQVGVDDQSTPDQTLVNGHAGESFAALVQSVDECVAMALANHPGIAAARQKVLAEKNRVAQALSLPDPRFSNTFWPVQEQSLQTAAGRVGNQMMLSQDIPWPEKRKAKASVVQREIQVAEQEVRQIERQIIESVRLAYYEVWYGNRAIEVVSETRALVDQMGRVAEARFRSGGPQQDVLRARLESDRLDEQLVRLTKQRDVAKTDLATLIGQPLVGNFDAEEELRLAEVGSRVGELVALAEQQNPKLAGLAWEVERDRQSQRLACLQQYPDLQVGIGWGLVNDNRVAISPVANGHDQISFTVGTSLPIYRRKIQAGIREAAHRTGSSTLRLEAERDSIKGQLRRLLTQSDALAEQRKYYEERIIPRVEDTLRLSFADYRGKRVDFFSLIETYRELLMLEMQLARIQASMAGTYARIERVIGAEIR